MNRLSRILSAVAGVLLLGAACTAGGGTAGPSSPPPSINPSKTNLALHKKVKSLSDEQPGYPAAAAVDGNLTTRWSSGFSDPQWIRVDLAAV